MTPIKTPTFMFNRETMQRILAALRREEQRPSVGTQRRLSIPVRGV